MACFIQITYWIQHCTKVLSRPSFLFCFFGTLLPAARHKSQQKKLVHIISVELPKITQCDGHEIVFFHQQGDSERAFAVSQHSV